ncbi:hypothetical protein [Halorhodospira halochloris]|uniref:hypothetical protein n=1 Tax=Halorhodospira halochloris TaxID=1052 RepID=UPI0013A5AA40|nr:hypothetical protein [Halorhodospira halochloris]
MNPSLEASWRHPWRQDLHTEAARLSGEFFEAPPPEPPSNLQLNAPPGASPET